MIFKPELAEAILDGRKWKTRRIVRPDERLCRYDDDTLYTPSDSHFLGFGIIGDVKKRRVKWGVGKTYAICPGRTKPAIGRLQITQIGWGRLGELDWFELAAEGIPPGENQMGQFIALWNNINRKSGTRYEDNPLVWILTFRVVEPIEAKIRAARYPYEDMNRERGIYPWNLMPPDNDDQLDYEPCDW